MAITEKVTQGPSSIKSLLPVLPAVMWIGMMDLGVIRFTVLRLLVSDEFKFRHSEKIKVTDLVD